MNGDKEATVKAYELLKAAHLAHPDDPVAQAYYGSATALLGRDLVDQHERTSKGLRGVKLLDRAVERVPDNIRVRALRAYVCLNLPEMYFHRAYTAVEDFRYLADRYEKDHGVFPEGFYWEILFNLGKAYQAAGRKAEAAETWKKLLSLTPDPKYRELLKEEGVMGVPFEPPATTGGRTASQEAAKETDDPELAEGVRLHDLAVEGDPEAARQAYEVLSRVCRKHPDALAEAYRASALSLVGKYSPEPGLMFENAITAMLTLDRLVAKHPDHVQIRFLRGQHSYRLPEAFFRRTATAVADFEYLLSLWEKRPGVLSTASVHRLLYDLGACYERLGMAGEAKAAWSRLLALQPAPSLATLVQKKLKDERDEARVRPVSPSSKAQLLEEGMRLHLLGVEGNREAAGLAHGLLAKAYALAPEDPLVEACYGSSVALQGKYARKPTEMFGQAMEGLRLLKKAAGRDWTDPRIRLMRGYLCYSLPDAFFPLLPTAIKDFKFVESAYKRGDRTIPETTYWQLLYDLGCALKRSGEAEKAQEVWKKLLSVSTDPKFRMLLNAEEVKMK